MSNRKNLALVAGALLACASVVSAVEPLSLDRPLYLADAKPADTSLMGLADKAGMGKTLSDYGLTIGGWVEASYTYNLGSPPGGINAGRVFDTKTQDPDLNQIVIFVNKDVDFASKTFQLGGRMEWMWGSDARFIHANGLFDHQSAASGNNEQFDLTQAYLDLLFPIGTGLRVRVGKFVTPFGLETINPNTNALYSHSYMFGYAIPYTHTGILGTYNVSPALQVTAGITRGWDQSLEDNNACAIDFLGSLTWTISKATTLTFTTSIGPERAGNGDDYRYMFDLVLSHKLSDQITLALNADFGCEEGAGIDGGNAHWYGVAGYMTYTINPSLAVNCRAEWFCDPDGGRGLGTTSNVYEVTVGLDIRPFSDKNLSSFRIRPEFRWDYSENAFFDGGNKHNQCTVAVDAIFGF